MRPSDHPCDFVVRRKGSGELSGGGGEATTSHMTSPRDNSANKQNANKGTTGTNKAYDKNQGNRGWQLNPQNPASSGKGAAKK